MTNRQSPPTAQATQLRWVLLVTFVRWERGAHAPMLPLRLFQNRTFAVGNVTMFLMTGATFAAAFLITQEFQFARGYSPISTGLRLLPFFGTPMVVSPLAGALSDRIGRSVAIRPRTSRTHADTTAADTLVVA
jgi:hypothetical protein